MPEMLLVDANGLAHIAKDPDLGDGELFAACGADVGDVAFATWGNPTCPACAKIASTGQGD